MSCKHNCQSESGDCEPNRTESCYESDKPPCQLIGIDGNVFNIIGVVSKTLKRAGQFDKASEFTKKAFASGSYEEVLNLTHEYVEVE